jgi:hypothetical protein
MTQQRPARHDIGTAYVGKEPNEYAADALRYLVSMSGAEVGFEACLTSRPFTAQTHVQGQIGAMAPGRLALAGRARAAQDLADGIETLRTCGYTFARGDVAGGRVTSDGTAVLLGPLRVLARWCPHEDRLGFGGAWRYILVREWGASDVVGTDPVFGGETCVGLEECGDVDVILAEPPTNTPDVSALARTCLSRGTSWRTDAASDHDKVHRDGAGLRASAEVASRLTSGLAAERTRLALWNYGLHATRWGGMLGALPALDTDTLALADALTAVTRQCEAAECVVRGKQADALGPILETLADLADAVTELSSRIAGSPA